MKSSPDVIKQPSDSADIRGMTDDELRRIRQEARLAQEDDESAVADFAASERTLCEVLVDYGKLGRLVHVEIAGKSVVGHVEHVGSDIVRLVTPEGRRLDLSIPAVQGIRVSDSGTRPSVVSTGHPRSMLARLNEAVQSEETVHLERRFGEAIDGRIVGVLDVAIEIRSKSASWIVPMGEISLLWRV